MVDLKDLLKKYFLVVRSHDDQGVIAPYTASFYSKISLAYKEVNEIHIDVDSPPDDDDIFYDWRGYVYKDEAGEPCVVVYVNDRFAGLYLPRLRSLYATDWSHNWKSVQLARKVIPRLASALGLKPLTEAEKRKALREFATSTLSKNSRVTVGGDPEFEMWRGNTLVSADDYLDMGDSIGTDGARNQVELRPAPGTPSQVVRSLRELIKEFAKRFPKYDLDAAGHKYPCGGHIHIGGIPDREPPGELLELLDDFIGKPSLPLSGEARGDYRRLSAWEDKPWGFEYRTPPAAVFSNPRVARTVLKLARNLVTKFYSGRALEYNDPPGVEDYIRVGGLTEREAAYLVEFFRQGVPRSLRIRAAWG
ncbi:putative amidoligase domain-containing protein, partial [Desulfovirgula thermocuniculi]|uniref:putative amidoligase domain-containing protein n=1 Tax=Desulfovirgula thermocuniculi TaxID=348842 RepID=UPI001B7F8986